MKNSSSFGILVLAAALTLGVPSGFSADTEPGSLVILPPGGVPVLGTGKPLIPSNYTTSGTFRSTDGTSGTFVETRAYNFYGTSNTGTSTVTIVYTLADASATSTDTTVTTFNTDGSSTVAFTRVGFGATAAFTATTTFAFETTTRTNLKGNTITSSGVGPYGTGTFTAADGTTGTLTTIRTNAPGSFIASTDYTSAATGLTRETRVEQIDGNRSIIKVVSVDAAGAVTTTIRTLSRGGRGHH